MCYSNLGKIDCSEDQGKNVKLHEAFILCETFMYEIVTISNVLRNM